MNILGRTYPPLSRRTLYLAAGACAILLLMLLSFPFGYDQSIFAVGGDLVLKHGAVPYRDFQEVKPPLIFYIYSASLALFGHHVWSVRALEAIWGAVTMLYLFRVLRREGLPEQLAIIAVLLTVVRSVGIGYGETAQVETFAVLPMVGLMDLTFRFSRGGNLLVLALLAGLATAALFLLKFTLIFALAGVAVFLVFDSRRRTSQRILFIAVTCAVFGSVFFAYLAWLFSVHGINYFWQALDWTRHYAEIDPLLGQETITKLYYVDFPKQFVHTFTLSALLLGVAGLVMYLLSLGRGDTDRDTRSQDARLLLTYLLFQTLLSLAGVFVERKFFPYHFTRAYWSFAPFVSIGLMAAIQRFAAPARALRFLPLFPKLTATAIAAVALILLAFYSPMMQLVSQPFYYTAAAFRGTVAESVERREGDYPYCQMQRLGDTLRTIMRPNEQMFYWGTDVATYFFADRVPTTNVLLPTPYIVPWVHPQWKRDVLQKLAQTHPEYFVVQTKDRTFLVTRTEKDSYQHLLDWPELRDYWTVNYQFLFKFGDFIVYRRNPAAGAQISHG